MSRKASAALLLALLILPPAASARVGAFSFGQDQVFITLHASEYRIAGEEDEQRIEMDGFGQFMNPGHPQLPMKRFLVALPPGAIARSVEVLGSSSEEIPGAYSIQPFPPIVFLPGMPRLDEAMERMRREWRESHDAVYASDEPQPRDMAWLAGRGSLRKYAYASVAFCPFTYHPESGRLICHSQVDVAVTYDLPARGSAESLMVEQSLRDRIADARAAELFANFDAVSELYQPVGTSRDDDRAAPMQGTYDYVVITISGLMNSITTSDFPAWKASLGHSIRYVLTTDTEITSQPGVDLAEQIRNFLRAHYATWGIEYVLLVGDYATVPMRICYPDPDFHVYDPADVGLVAPGTPSDYYYADLSLPDSVSWDSDGDGYIGEYGQDDPDFLAEVAVGRIPVNNATRITYTLNKLVAFEQDTGAWKNNALLAGSILFFENQNYGGYPFIDGMTCLDSIGTGLMGGMNLTCMAEKAGIVVSGFPYSPISETAFNDAWRGGQHAIVNWSGHGWSDGAYRTCWNWDDGDGVPEQGNGEMQSYQFIHRTTSSLDDDYPSIVFAISCNVGYPDPNPYGNCGIDLLTKLGWGASAGIVSSARPAAVSSDWKNSPGGTEQICYEFDRYMIAEGERVGDALYDGKYHAHTYYGWDRVYEYMNLYNFNLYGDPALAVDGASAGVTDSPNRGTENGLRLGPGEPNPFASTTTLTFALPRTGHVRIDVHDVRGRLVATLADRRYEAGEHGVTWDGTGGDGLPVAPGLYVLRVEADRRQAARKVVLIK